MKRYIPALLALFLFSACNREYTEVDYLVSVTGDDYSDDIVIPYESRYTNDNPSEKSYLGLNGGVAVMKAYKSDDVKFVFPPYSPSNALVKPIPTHQTHGDSIHIVIHKRKPDGSSGDYMGEGDVICGDLSEKGRAVIFLEW